MLFRSGIVPRGVTKDIADIMEGARTTRGRGKKGQRRVAERVPDYLADVTDLSPKALSKRINELESKMLEHARNLEFEEAAQVRDQLQELRVRAFVA